MAGEDSVIVPDTPDTLVLSDSGEHGDVCAGVILHLSEDAAVFCITKSQMQPDGICGQPRHEPLSVRSKNMDEPGVAPGPFSFVAPARLT